MAVFAAGEAHPDARIGAMLAFLKKMTLDPDGLGPDDVAPLAAAGLERQQIEDAIHVGFLFAMYNRAADAFGFALLDDAGYQRSAWFLLNIGYR